MEKHSSLSSSMLGNIQFLKKLLTTESSHIFHVLLEGVEYCLKVFHMNEDPGFADDGRGLCRYRCESESYKALYSAGVCSEGYVPYFYGLLEHINPKDIPSLSAFTNDTRLPNAILLEYLPNASSFSIENFSRELFHLASEGLKTVHNARVIHNDPYLKNVLVSEAEAGGKRVVWMDFDIAIVFPTDSKMRGSLDLEEEIRLEREFFECVSGRVEWQWAETQGVKQVFGDINGQIMQESSMHGLKEE